MKEREGWVEVVERVVECTEIRIYFRRGVGLGVRWGKKRQKERVPLLILVRAARGKA